MVSVVSVVVSVGTKIRPLNYILKLLYHQLFQSQLLQFQLPVSVVSVVSFVSVVSMVSVVSV